MEHRVADFRVEAVVLNNHIVRRMIDRGFACRSRHSITKLCEAIRAAQIDHSTEREIVRIILLQELPARDDEWTEAAQLLAWMLDEDPDALWPGDLKWSLPSDCPCNHLVSVGEVVSWRVMPSSDR